MALTPEDVVNKRFQATKFREGYDQDEVDDFLDEVVVELRRLSQENEELRQQVSSGSSGSATPVPSGEESAESSGDEDRSEAPAAETPASYTEPVPATPEPAAPAATTPTPASTEEDEGTSSTNLLQLARRLHEEHVREGVEKRDALVAEGHATAARVVAEAEAKQRAQMGKLEEERNTLEKRVDDLRVFEREYRGKLKSYIEGQLKDLDQSAPVNSRGSSSAPAGSSDSASDSSETFQGFGG